VLAGIQIWAMQSRKDIWPLSSYQMFSQRMSLSDIDMYHLQGVTSDGKTILLELPTHKFGFVGYDVPIRNHDWKTLSEQALIDYQANLRNRPELNEAHIVALQVLELKQQPDVRDKIALTSKVLLTVQVGDHSFHVADL